MKEHSHGENGHKWEGCQVFKDYHEMLEKTTKDKKPDAIIIGVPPWLHGEHRSCMVVHRGPASELPACSSRFLTVSGLLHLLVKLPTVV